MNEESVLDIMNTDKDILLQKEIIYLPSAKKNDLEEIGKKVLKLSFSSISYTFVSESSLGGNPITVRSHSCIDTWLILFTTSISPAYYSNKLPDICGVCIN
jgi:hypothetical protein